MSLNSVCITGRLGRDPELRTTTNGVSVCSFAVAVDRDYMDANGKRGTDWFQCVAWRQRAEFITKYYHKGSGITLHGRLEARSYEDNEGIKRVVTEIIVSDAYFVDKKGDRQEPPLPEAPPDRQATAEAGGNYTEVDVCQYGELEDDLPF